VKSISKICYSILIICFISLVTVYSCFGNNNIQILTEVDKNVITVGDIIHYNVIVKYNKDIKPYFSSQWLNLDKFELLDSAKSENEENGMTVDKFLFKISIYKTGDFEIPPPVFKYAGKDGKEETVKAEKPIKITVKSVLAKDGGDIKPLKPQREFNTPFPFKMVIIVFLSIIIIMLLIFISRYIYGRYKGKNIAVEKPVPLLPPEDEASKALDELEKSDFLNKGEIKEFYIVLSDIARRYMERRFYIMTFEKTTDEIIDQLVRKNILKTSVRNVNNLLVEFDLVKFAKMIPSVSEARGHILKTRNFVEETTEKKSQEEKEEK